MDKSLINLDKSHFVDFKRRRKSPQNGVKAGRAIFWRYCITAEARSRTRARNLGIPHAIDRYFIDELLVDGNWTCAVSGLPLNHTMLARKTFRDPFGPSLDRIDNSKGYVPGNVRIVCNIVNYAINEWGEEPLYKLVRAMKARKPKSAKQEAPP
jgi:hypothetical protein